MLIEFKVANFRSIREQQTLSLVASNADKSLNGGVIEHPLPGLAGLRFLKGAALYGANASGKSNVIQAMGFLRDCVVNSATKLQPGNQTGAEPFKLDRESITKPSEFEITFVADITNQAGEIQATRFVFGLAITPQRVIEEYLVAYPKGLPQKWYHRIYNETEKAYEWAKPSTGFKRNKSLEQKTRENCLYLSVGPQFNHPQLTKVFNWFNLHLRLISLNHGADISYVRTIELLKNPAQRDRILNLLKSADIGIGNANIDVIKSKPEILELLQLSKQFDQAIKAFQNMSPRHRRLISAFESQSVTEEGILPEDSYSVNLMHTAEGVDPVPLDFDDEESSGTRHFFALIGFWIEILEGGFTVFIDEIETSLHPLLVKELLRLLLSETHNTKGAQIIFTTHNPVLLDTTLFRRDQIWFTEKSPNGATQLYPLTDYQPRKDEALAKGYLAGRYGGIPFIPEGLKL